MQVTLKPTPNNRYSVAGFIIKSAQMQDWLVELQKMEFSLSDIDVYALPGTVANKVWACLVIPKSTENTIGAGRHQRVLRVHRHLLIAEYSELWPQLATEELDELLKGKTSLMHPEIGLFELENPIDWLQFIHLNEADAHITIPEDSEFIPHKINAYVLEAPQPDKVLEDLMGPNNNKGEKLQDRPLNLLEKIRLGMYELFSRKEKRTEGGGKGTIQLPAWLQNIMPDFINKFFDKMEADHEDLLERNKKELDKLMEMLKNDPANALKYAIPLDESGLQRGSDDLHNGLFRLFELFPSLNLNAGAGGNGSGRSINLGAEFYRLREQYEQTAKNLIAAGDYKKAAFVYLKLLKDAKRAAQTLENGKEYAEAASVYLKYLKDKRKAAECYEKGKMLLQATELYVEMKDYMKAAELYKQMGKYDSANGCYESAADRYKHQKDYFSAASIYHDYLNLPEQGQGCLWHGWQHLHAPTKCLTKYFENIIENEVLEREVRNCHSELDDSEAKAEKQSTTGVSAEQRKDWLLQAMLHVLKKRDKLSATRDLAYKIIADKIIKHPELSEQLTVLDQQNTELKRDTMRYRLNVNEENKRRRNG